MRSDLEDLGPRFDGAPDLEFRAATKPLGLEKAALSYQRIPPGYRFPYGHTHLTQEEVYVVVRGSGRMKVDDEIVEVGESALRLRLHLGGEVQEVAYRLADVPMVCPDMPR